VTARLAQKKAKEPAVEKKKKASNWVRTDKVSTAVLAPDTRKGVGNLKPGDKGVRMRVSRT